MQKAFLHLLVIALLFGAIPLSAQVKERWDVKTLTDGFTTQSGIPKKTTIKELEKIPLTKVGNTTPRLPIEKNLIQVTGTITRLTKEKDGDYHIEIQDVSSDSTLPCESVSPIDKEARKSPFINKFRAVRAALLTKEVGDIVTITGVEFQDKFHKPSPLRIRNFIEIHPIINIQ